MKNDMVCHMTEGELAVVQNKNEFTVKKGDVWTCAKADTTEGTQNKGSAVAIMRIIDLMTGMKNGSKSGTGGPELIDDCDPCSRIARHAGHGGARPRVPGRDRLRHQP